MLKIKYRGIELNGYTRDGRAVACVTICRDCVEKYKDILDHTKLDFRHEAVCCVEGCKNSDWDVLKETVGYLEVDANEIEFTEGN